MIYINSIAATQEDLSMLERNLRNGMDRATAKVINGDIYITTK